MSLSENSTFSISVAQCAQHATRHHRRCCAAMFSPDPRSEHIRGYQRLSGLRQSYGNVDVTRSVAYRNSHRTKVCAALLERGVACESFHSSLLAPPTFGGLKACFAFLPFRRMSAVSLRQRKERASAPPPADHRNVWASGWTSTEGIQSSWHRRLPLQRQIFSVIDFFLENYSAKVKVYSFLSLHLSSFIEKKSVQHALSRLTHWKGQNKTKKSKVSLFQNPLAANSCYVTGWPPLSVNGFATQFINRCVLAESALAISIIGISNASEKMWVILLEFYDTRIKSIEI